MLTPLKRLF